MVEEQDDLRADFSDAIKELQDDSSREPAAQLDGVTQPATEPKDTLPLEEPTAKEGEQKELEPKPRNRAPASWKAEEREGWEATPEPARAAILRREREIDSALRESADARAFIAEFSRTIQPYQQYITADGSTPLTAVRNMMQTAAVLSSAAPGRKAAEVANMIRHFNIDINLLDEALSAVMSGQRPTAPRDDSVLQLVDQRLAPINAYLEQIRQSSAQQAEATRQELRGEWDKFASAPENEFAEDLREEIADILDVAARRGHAMDLQAAYKRATLLHPTISKLVEQRQAAQSAAQQTAAARRAKDAAASLSSSAPSREDGTSGTGSLRDDIANSIGQLANRR